MIDMLSFLKSLLSVPGISAFENPVGELISAAWRPLVDELSTSNLGSLHGLCYGSAPHTPSDAPGHPSRPCLLLSAHMDTIGLMVTGQVDGFIRVTGIGGVDVRTLPGQPVTVHGRQEIPAIVVQPPVHLLPPNLGKNPVAMGYLWVDTGLLPAQTAELVKVGDPVSFAQPPFELTEGALCGHSLDNRASVAALTACLEELHLGRSHAWDVWASVQEETGSRGARTSSFQLRPDMAVAIDVTFARGPGASDYKSFPLGKGVTLGWGAPIHPALFKKFKEIATRLEIPFETEMMPRCSGTDADSIQVTAEGIPTMVISIPLRYMHTPVEVVSLKDIRRAGRLLAEFVCCLEPDFLTKITWDK
jgi:putative aminopeptidase FrvX